MQVAHSVVVVDGVGKGTSLVWMPIPVQLERSRGMTVRGMRVCWWGETPDWPAPERVEEWR